MEIFDSETCKRSSSNWIVDIDGNNIVRYHPESDGQRLSLATIPPNRLNHFVKNDDEHFIESFFCVDCFSYHMIFISSNNLDTSGQRTQNVRLRFFSTEAKRIFHRPNWTCTHANSYKKKKKIGKRKRGRAREKRNKKITCTWEYQLYMIYYDISATRYIVLLSLTHIIRLTFSQPKRNRKRKSETKLFFVDVFRCFALLWLNFFVFFIRFDRDAASRFGIFHIDLFSLSYTRSFLRFGWRVRKRVFFSLKKFFFVSFFSFKWNFITFPFSFWNGSRNVLCARVCMYTGGTTWYVWIDWIDILATNSIGHQKTKPWNMSWNESIRPVKNTSREKKKDLKQKRQNEFRKRKREKFFFVLCPLFDVVVIAF